MSAAKPYRWATWGDANAFFGLIIDNVAVLVLLVVNVSRVDAGPNNLDFFTPQFVITHMIPGTVLGVLVGDLVYTIMAFRLARRTGRDDVTAMPLGLDTPSTFAVAYLVLLPALHEGLRHHPGDHDAAMAFGWHVGALTLVLVGIGKSAIAPIGNAVRRWVPRAGLLGSLAAIALALIAFMPLLSEIASVPLVGMLSLAVILAALVARWRLPFNLPGALAALLLGMAAYGICRGLENAFGWPLAHATEGLPPGSTTAPLPAEIWHLDWWLEVLSFTLTRLPLIFPFALATVVGGIDCTESAATVGDEYDTRSVLLTEGVASTIAGLAGGVIQNTPYIGQPAYKVMGGRAAYTLATGLFIAALGWSGWFGELFALVPKAAMFPILVFVGLEITAQSFHAVPVKHYPAVALAILPALAYLGKTLVDIALAGRPAASPGAAAMLQTLTCLANGFIVTSLLWGAALAALIDGRARPAAYYLLVAALLSLVGVMHSPMADALIVWPWTAMADLPEAARYQTPYHWAGAYVLMAAMLAWSAGGAPVVEPAPENGVPSDSKPPDHQFSIQE